MTNFRRVELPSLCLLSFIGVALTCHSARAEQPPTPQMRYSKATITYKTVGDLQVQADVYQLPSQSLRPGIMFIHGGALMVGSRVGAPPAKQLERYLNAGYNVVSVDYRLAPETKLPEIVKDVEDAYNWMRTNSGVLAIDPDRIAVIGASAGGYLTQVAGYRLHPTPKALVSFYGYGNITGPWYSKPSTFYRQQHPMVTADEAMKSVGTRALSEGPVQPAWQGRGAFYLYCRQQGLWPTQVGGHDPEKERVWFADYEPHSNVSATYPPTMLLHGEHDTDVPFEQSVTMARLLASNGVAHEFVSRPEWGHGFDLRQGDDPAVVAAMDRVIAFLAKHVRDVGHRDGTIEPSSIAPRER